MLTHLHALPRDAREVTLLDHAIDPPAEVTLQVDPALGPKQQAEVWFRRARKLERGAAIARERAQAASARAAALEALAARAHAATDPAELTTAASEAQALGIGPAPSATGPAAKRGQPGARVPYREFAGSGGRAILVGRGASDNDRLTLDHARPQDLWLHRATRPARTWWSRSSATRPARPICCATPRCSPRTSARRAGMRAWTSCTRRAATCVSRARQRPAACS